MGRIPQRYKDIRSFISGLHTSNCLLSEKSELAFLNTDEYWYSHVQTNEKDGYHSERPLFFSVRYMKHADEVVVVSNFYSFQLEYEKWLNNTLGYDLKQEGFLDVEIERRYSRYGHNFFVKVKLDKDKDYTKVYDVYMLFKKYHEQPGKMGII